MLKYDLTKTIEVTIGVVLLWVALLIQFFYPEIFSDYDFLVYIFFSLWLLRILYINKKPPQKNNNSSFLGKSIFLFLFLIVVIFSYEILRKSFNPSRLFYTDLFELLVLLIILAIAIIYSYLTFSKGYTPLVLNFQKKISQSKFIFVILYLIIIFSTIYFFYLRARSYFL